MVRRMLEIEDYTGDYFFLESEDLEEYNDIVEQINEEEEKFAYDIFTLQQSLSTLKEFKNHFGKVGEKATVAISAIEDFIEVYTENQE